MRETLARLAQATASKDYEALCHEVLAPALVERVRSAGLTCEGALRTGLRSVRKPRLTVRRVEVKGSRAVARVHTQAANQPPSDDTVALVEVDGEWRVASLARPRGGG